MCRAQHTLQPQVFGDPKEDTQLQHTLRVLQEVHRLYYPPADAHEDAQPPAAAPSQQRPKNVASCLAAVRRPCLAGCSLVFSGLVPRGVDPRKTDLGYMATALGATVTEALAEGTTHVVAENPSTEKVYHARQRTGARAVHVVTRVWLQLSFWHCERKPEADFPLLAPPKVGRDGKDAAVPVVPPAPTAAAPAGAAPATVEVREAEEGPVSKRAKIEVSEERVEEKEKAEGGGGKEEDGSPRVPTVMAETAAAAVTAATIKDGGAEEEEEDEDWAAALADELG